MATAPTPETRMFTRGDTLVSLLARLDKADGSIPALTGSVEFWMKLKSHAKDKTYPNKIAGKTARIVNADTRQVAYDWEAEDVDEAADYFAWFVHIPVVGSEEHFPGQGRYLTVKIVEAEGDEGNP